MNLRQSNAEFAPAPQFAKAGSRARVRGAKAEGLRYQSKVEDFLRRELGTDSLKIGPWIRYAGSLYRQPDALYFDGVRGIVVETKLKHCFEGWSKLRQIYQPLVESILDARVAVLEICRGYDITVDIPEKPRFTQSLFDLECARFNVMIWQPKLGALPCPKD